MPPPGLRSRKFFCSMDITKSIRFRPGDKFFRNNLMCWTVLVRQLFGYVADLNLQQLFVMDRTVLLRWAALVQ